MKRFPTSFLSLLVLIATLSSGFCENELLPELTRTLTGQSLRWPCQSTRNIYETSGRYLPRNVIATRVQIHGEHAIVALPRYKPGVPFTLGVVELRIEGCTPKITAAPCWAIQEEGNCQALQNVVDLVMDIQHILWVLDVGIVNTLEQPIRRCSPKIVGIDLISEKVVKVIDLSDLVSTSSRLQYMTIDYSDRGEFYVYVADAGTRSIIVYNVTGDKGHRVVLPKAVASGAESRDALYIALIRKHGAAILYFTYLNGSGIFAIKAANLQSGNAHGSIVQVGAKKNKIVVLGTDNGSAIFFRQKGDSEIYMWNTDTAFVPENFLLVQKGCDSLLPTQVIPGFNDLMWVLESNFHDYIQNTVSCSGATVSLHPIVKTCDD